MAILYSMCKRKNLGVTPATDIWCPTVKSRGTLDIEAISAEISKRCTVSAADSLAVIRAMEDVIAEKLEAGYRVQLHTLGTFGIRIQSEAPANGGTAYVPRRVFPTFYPGKRIRTTVAEAQLTVN